MKIKNFALLAVSAVALAACGGSSKITEPARLDGAKVFFGFDSATISEDSRANLLGQALYMKNHKDTEVVIAGNCDERGTTEYNLALGQRRANAAKAVIVNDGVSSGRIATVSYGKERPSVMGSGESAWGQNRNATTYVK